MTWFHVAAFAAGCAVGILAALAYERFPRRATWKDWQ